MQEVFPRKRGPIEFLGLAYSLWFRSLSALFSVNLLSLGRLKRSQSACRWAGREISEWARKTESESCVQTKNGLEWLSEAGTREQGQGTRGQEVRGQGNMRGRRTKQGTEHRKKTWSGRSSFSSKRREEGERRRRCVFVYWPADFGERLCRTEKKASSCSCLSSSYFFLSHWLFVPPCYIHTYPFYLSPSADGHYLFRNPYNSMSFTLFWLWKKNNGWSMTNSQCWEGNQGF